MTEPCVDLRINRFTFGPFRGGIYSMAYLRWVSGKRDRRVEVAVSPTGRSVSVYVDGEQWGPITRRPKRNLNPRRRNP